MPDFDTNEDPLGLPGSSQGGAPDPAELRNAVGRRVFSRQGIARHAARMRGAELLSRAPRRPARHCVDFAAARVCAPGLQPRRRRVSMWTIRHGRLPGSPS
jgi:hypothetical protein